MCATPPTLRHAGESRHPGRGLDTAACEGRRRLPAHLGAMLLLAALLGGCALAPTKGPPGAATGRDGPEANPPPDLAARSDAEPKLEPIRVGGPNKPYVVLGRAYVPMTQDRPFAERGLASWYGRKFQGKPTSSGEPYDMYAMTAAHPTMPIPSYARVRNPANGREVLVRVNDRGPFHPGRVIDLSYTAALKLDLLRGVAPVEVERITFDEIRTGAWRRPVDVDAVRLAAANTKGADADAAAALAGTAAEPVTAKIDAKPPAAIAMADPALASAAAEPVPTFAAEPTATVAAVGSSVPADGAAAVVADAPVTRAVTQPPGFWVQLAAFREQSGAATFQRRVARELEWLKPLLAVFDDAALYRLQAGPYPSRDSARAAADSIRAALQLVPVVIERR